MRLRNTNFKIILVAQPLIFIFSTVFCQKAVGQIHAMDFYPLETNNYWEYFVDGWMGMREDSLSVSVKGDTLIAETSYKTIAIKSFRFKTTSSLFFERVDATGDVYELEPSSGSENLLFRLSDTLRTFWNYGSNLARFDSSYIREIFSEPRKAFLVSVYAQPDTFWIFGNEIAEGIGRVSTFTSHLQGSFLQGAIISGVQYGTVTSVKNDLPKFPSNFYLAQNYPNPFNPETKIYYQLPKTEHVTLKIFNALGQEIRTLIKAIKPAGPFIVRWDGRDKNGHQLPSGLYLYQIQAGGFRDIKKLLLIR